MLEQFLEITCAVEEFNPRTQSKLFQLNNKKAKITQTDKIYLVNCYGNKRNSA